MFRTITVKDCLDQCKECRYSFISRFDNWQELEHEEMKMYRWFCGKENSECPNDECYLLQDDFSVGEFLKMI